MAQTFYPAHTQPGEVREETPLVKGRWAVQERLSTASLQTQLRAVGALDPQNHTPRLAAVLQHGLLRAALCACWNPLLEFCVPPGLRRVMVKNMWFGYSSLQHCLSGAGSSAVPQDVSASDGGQK